MKKLNCAICDKYKKFKNRKTSYIFWKTFFLLTTVSAIMKMKNIWRRRINWDIEDSWFNLKYIITLKKWFKKLD